MKCELLTVAEILCVSLPPDDNIDRHADRNQLLLCRGRTKLLREESGVSPRQTEGDERFDLTAKVILYMMYPPSHILKQTV